MNIPSEILFEGSYVLALEIAPYSLKMVMDFEILPSHPNYSHPKSDERACFRQGTLKIVNFIKLTWNASGLLPTIDANQEIDWGCLDEFSVLNHEWHLAGDWGSINIDGGALEIAITEK